MRSWKHQPGSDPRCPFRRPRRSARRRRRASGDRCARADASQRTVPPRRAARPAPNAPMPRKAATSTLTLGGCRRNRGFAPDAVGPLTVASSWAGEPSRSVRDSAWANLPPIRPGRKPKWGMCRDEIGEPMSASIERMEAALFDEDSIVGAVLSSSVIARAVRARGERTGRSATCRQDRSGERSSHDLIVELRLDRGEPFLEALEQLAELLVSGLALGELALSRCLLVGGDEQRRHGRRQEGEERDTEDDHATADDAAQGRGRYDVAIADGGERDDRPPDRDAVVREVRAVDQRSSRAPRPARGRSVAARDTGRSGAARPPARTDLSSRLPSLRLGAIAAAR